MITTMTVPTIQEETGFAKGYLRISEAAKRLGVHPRTITRWVHDGKFPGTIKNDPDAITGSFFRIPAKAIEAFEKRRLITPLDEG